MARVKVVHSTLPDLKHQMVTLVGKGVPVKEAILTVGRTLKTYENWRANDKDFAFKVDSARANLKKAEDHGEDPEIYHLTFAEWRKRYLGRDTYPHQQLWIDVLEGKEPKIWHPSIQYIKRNKNRVLINCPPHHCVVPETPMFTRDGWKTMAEVTTSDLMLGAEGLFWPVAETIDLPDAELYDVVFDTGDIITTDAGHRWEVINTRTKRVVEMTTEGIMNDLTLKNDTKRVAKWKVAIGQPCDPAETPLPVDPYLLGYWLGDGATSGSTLTVSVGDLASLTGHLSDLGLSYSIHGDSRNPETTKVVYVKGIRATLSLGNKRIPEAYFVATHKERLALLQGLMDTDGTINPADGRASFIQVADGLSRDVYRLISSLGFKASWKKEKHNQVALNGTANSLLINRIYFKPNGDDVFHLERKRVHQRVTVKGCKTGHRMIREVRNTGRRGPVRCLTVASPGNQLAYGDAMIQGINSKSTTITQEYATYRLCMNPAIRIVIISKTRDFASTFLFSIKTMLTDPEYIDLQKAYGPPDGFRPQRGDGQWASSVIYLADRNLNAEDKAAKDPSVVALGIGAAVYGRRADLIIVDDAIDDNNAGAYVKQFDWLTRTVLSRNKSGIVLIVGTRVAPMDLYSYLLNDDIYTTGVSPWTVLKTPAVLEYAENPEDWVTLWPRSTQLLDENMDIEAAEDGTYAAWDGAACMAARADNRPMIWSLVWQQQETSDEMTFKAQCVRGCVDGRRKAGPLKAGAWGHPKFGAEGMTIMGSIDPAGTGQAFLLVYALDRATKERYVLNAWMGSDTLPSWYAAQIKEISPIYGVTEWVIEAQGYSNWLYHDEAIMRYCRERGIKISPSYTGRNKIDPDFGVASMEPLFGSTSQEVAGGKLKHNHDNLIHLPDPDSSKGVKTLIDQLVSWVPGIPANKLRQDGPMALWFAETRARLYITGGDRPPSSHATNRYLSRRAMRRQYVTITR